MPDAVLIQVEEAVATLTLNRPEALNCFDPVLVTTLRRLLEQVAADRDVRAVVLAGAGRAFSAGADLKVLLPRLRADGLDAEGQAVVQALHDCARAVRNLPVPVVAAVRGACAGGGLGLALAADITWASRSAVFSTGFNAIGLTPDTATSYLLPRAVGDRMARELLYTSRRIDAAEALRIGLVTRVVDDDALMSEVHDLARRLAVGSVATMVRTRELIDQASRQDLDAQLDLEVQCALERMASTDLAEGVRAFIEKRSPTFSER